MNEVSGALVDVQWLKHQLRNNDDLVLLHTSMANPITGEAPVIGERVIPTAMHFDFEQEFCDLASDLPHTMPSAEIFETHARLMGIDKNSTIVVYDDHGIYCSPRVWWMFKTMGHQQVYVLNGGLPAWAKHGFDCQSGFSEVAKEGNFNAISVQGLMLDLKSLLLVKETPGVDVVDARSAGRFYANEPEPRVGVRGGHIPNSKNIPFNNVLNNEGMQSTDVLLSLFKEQGLDMDRKLIFSCGSGVTACILALAAYQVGYTNIAVYDGSWSEWGANDALPIE